MPISEDLQKFLQDVGTRVASETADVISTVIGKDCSITLDEIQEQDTTALSEQITDPYIEFRFNITPAEEDVIYLFLNQSLGAQMASLMMMEETAAEFSDAHLDAIKEMGEQVVGTLATVLSEHMGRELRFGSARVTANEAGTGFPEIESPAALFYTFKIGDEEPHKIIQVGSQAVLERFQSGEPAAESAEPAPAEEETQAEEEMTLEPPTAEEGEMEEEELPADEAPETGDDDFDMSGLGDLGGMGDEAEEGAAQSTGGNLDDLLSMGGGEESMEPAREGAISFTRPQDVQPEKIEILLDLSLPVSIELGRTKMLIKDILELGHGSVIEFDKLAGEPVDLLIYDKKVAEGEVVVIDEHFGIRLTNIIKTAERLKTLGGQQ